MPDNLRGNNALPDRDSPVGLLLSGGLDSVILLGELLGGGRRVQPFYVQCGLSWEREELWAVKSLLIALDCGRLEPLVVFDMPLDDVYGRHWSITGIDVPNAVSPDAAVYLPGRNALLTLKPALWCGLHGIEELALAVLDGNPFADAGERFFGEYESALRQALGCRLRLLRPFGRMKKTEVMQRGRDLPLELSFSCIHPRQGLHCGACNKCAERQRAFAESRINDPTRYAIPPAATSSERD